MSLKHFSDATARFYKENCLLYLWWDASRAVESHVAPVLLERFAKRARLECNLVAVCPVDVRYKKRIALAVAEIVLHDPGPTVRFRDFLSQGNGPAPVFLDLAGAGDDVSRTVRLDEIFVPAVLEVFFFGQVVPVSGLQYQPVLSTPAPVRSVGIRLPPLAHQVPVSD